MLDGNPRVVSLEEHELLADGVLAFMREPVNFQALMRADAAALDALREAYWRGVRGAGIDVAGKIFLDKHPLNSLKLPLIAKLFPQAKILFAVRDPRDVILSCFRRRFQMNPSMYEFLTVPGAAAFYDAVMEFAYTAKRGLGLEWHEVRYERLIENFEQEMRAICGYLSLDWLASMGEFADRVQAREHATPSTAQLCPRTRDLRHGAVAALRTALEARTGGDRTVDRAFGVLRSAILSGVPGRSDSSAST